MASRAPESIFWSPLSPFRYGLASNIWILLARSTTLLLACAAALLLALAFHLITLIPPAAWVVLSVAIGIVVVLGAASIAMLSARTCARYTRNLDIILRRDIRFMSDTVPKEMYALQSRTREFAEEIRHYERDLLKTLHEKNEMIQRMHADFMETLDRLQYEQQNFLDLFKAQATARISKENIHFWFEAVTQSIPHIQRILQQKSHYSGKHKEDQSLILKHLLEKLDYLLKHIKHELESGQWDE